MEEKYTQLKIRAEAAALKMAEKRQQLREMNERREVVLNRINNQRQRQSTIKERLQAKLKKRNENNVWILCYNKALESMYLTMYSWRPKIVYPFGTRFWKKETIFGLGSFCSRFR